MKSPILFFLIALLSTAQAQQQKLPSFITDSLDSYIRNGMRDWQLPGLAIGIVKDTSIIFLKGYGIKEAGMNEAVDENTLFMIGSNTKAFTGIAIAMLDHEKKLSLTDPVRKWLPDFQLKDPLATREANITDMLTHRIGFETFQGDFTYWTSKLTRQEVISKMALITPVYSFRTKWGYTNAGFLTAGEIIPKATGLAWEEYVAERILKPLKMERTLVLSKDLPSASNRASAHTMYKGKLINIPIPMIDNLAPAGSMSSSAKEMCNWLRMLVQGGTFEGKEIIPSRAILASWKPHSIRSYNYGNINGTHFHLYGLGFGIADRAGRAVISHTGGVDGFVSSVVLIPEEKIGIVILTNNDLSSFFINLSDEVRDAFLGLPFRNYSAESLKEFKKEQEDEKRLLDSLGAEIAKRNKPPVALKEFTGRYFNEVYGDIFVKQDKDRLYIDFPNHPGMRGNLEFISDTTFLCTYSNPTMGIKEIPFKIDNGTVTGLTLRVADFVEFLPYEFRKM